MKKQPKQEKSSIPIVLPGQLCMFAELDTVTECFVAKAESEVLIDQAYKQLEFDFNENQLELFSRFSGQQRSKNTNNDISSKYTR